MGTWICHLRIAEKLLPHFPELDKTLFAFGNLAPDSGIPTKHGQSLTRPRKLPTFCEKAKARIKSTTLSITTNILQKSIRRMIFNYTAFASVILPIWFAIFCG